MVGGKLTWADIHLFYFCSDEFLEPEVLKDYPKISELVAKVGEVPSIKKHLETRPAKPTSQNKEYQLLYQNAYNLVKNDLI